jgi:hypothetical protein
MHYPIDELKLVYRVLHRQLSEFPALLDVEFLYDLQRHLQRQAITEGVDVSDHGAWDTWLGNESISCARRVASRQTIVVD